MPLQVIGSDERFTAAWVGAHMGTLCRPAGQGVCVFESFAMSLEDSILIAIYEIKGL